MGISTFVATEAFIEQANEINNERDQTLEQGGLARNRTKQDVAICFKNWKGNRRTQRSAPDHREQLGRVLPQIKHLGAMFDPTGANGCERRCRAQAIKAGWAQFRGIWSSRIPARLKRLSFIIKVQSAGITGMETFLMAKIDYQALDTPMTKYLRAMLKGKAYDEANRKAMTNVDVWRFWKLCPSELELRVRRLKWYQDMVENMNSHGQVITALFGHPKFEHGIRHPTLDEQGYLSEEANSFAKRFINDLNTLRKLQVGKPLSKSGTAASGRSSQTRTYSTSS